MEALIYIANVLGYFAIAAMTAILVLDSNGLVHRLRNMKVDLLDIVLFVFVSTLITLRAQEPFISLVASTLGIVFYIAYCRPSFIALLERCASRLRRATVPE